MFASACEGAAFEVVDEVPPVQPASAAVTVSAAVAVAKILFVIFIKIRPPVFTLVLKQTYALKFLCVKVNIIYSIIYLLNEFCNS